MTSAETRTAAEIELLRQQARSVRRVVQLQVAGLSHEDSLIQPRPAGNCLNWVLGHLQWVYEGTLPVLGQKPVLGQTALQRYARKGQPIQSADEARDFGELVKAWDEACSRVDHGLASLAPETLTRPAPHSPNDNPDETVGTLLCTVMFHQAYHAGQAAILRRIAGKEGAIR
jgi:uncharacterized damage-inducible protein DinB